MVDTAGSIITVLLAPSAIRTCVIVEKDVGRGEFSVVQEGTLHGVRFKVWESSEGGGSIQAAKDADLESFSDNWSMTCKIDKIDDEPLCYVQRKDVVVVRSPRGSTVTIGGENYPGSDVSVRIDDRPPLRAAAPAFVGAAADRVVSQMRTGKRMITRYQKWPYKSYLDDEWSLYGAPEALELLERAFTSLRKARSIRVTTATARTADVAVAQPSPRVRASSGEVYFEFQVERQAKLEASAPAPVYPPMLRSARVEGEVLAQFVVDTLGTVETNTFKVITSTHDLFTSAVKNVLPQLKFSPAEIAAVKVRQLVQMPFTFSLNR